MSKIFPLIIISSILAYSCSSSDKKENKAENTKSSEEVSSDDSLESSAEDDLEEDFKDDEKVSADSSDESSSEMSMDDGGEKTSANDQEEELVGDDDANLEEDFEDEVSEEVADIQNMEGDELEDFEGPSRSLSSAVQIGGEISSFKVKKGETLMLLAFHKYGDYTKWKLLRDLNPGINPHSLKAGQVLKYRVPENEFNWMPNGTPYLIQRGDTLGKISNSKYGTPTKWKSIYENNRPMIKNPNLIFAGFTLYYIDGESEFAFNN